MDVPILMYHEVAEPSEIPKLTRKTQRGYILVADTFRQQVAWLASNGFRTIGLEDLLQPSDVDDGRRSIVITFDDGHLGNYVHAVPILREYGFTAIFFVISNKVGTSGMMTWKHLREMRSLGMSVESHTANHPLLSALDSARTRAELIDSKLQIEDQIGAPVHFLSLPNGDSNTHYVESARKAGYRGGCCSEFGYNNRTTNPYFLRRIAIKDGMSDEVFSGLVRQEMKIVRAVQRRERFKRAIVTALGKRNYDRLYNLAFRVEEQDISKRV